MLLRLHFPQRAATVCDSISEDDLSEVVALAAVFNADFVAEVVQCAAHCFELRGGTVIVGLLNFVDWVALEVTEQLWQVFRFAVRNCPLELCGIEDFFDGLTIVGGRLVGRLFFVVVSIIFLDFLFLDLWRFKFLVSNI